MPDSHFFFFKQKTAYEMRISDWSSDVCSSDLLMADCKIRDVYTGIAGSHIRSFNSSGMVAVKDKEVTATDVARVIETAKAVNIPTDQQVLHVLTQEFIVDGQEDIREPIGMRSEEHTSELQSLMRISYAVFCLKKKKQSHTQQNKKK